MARNKIDIPTNVLNSYYERLSKKEQTTYQLARRLGAREYEELGNFVQLPLLVPTGNKQVLMLYIRVFLHLRSPSWTPPNRFKITEPNHIVARCRTHLQNLHAIHEHKPDPEWAQYLMRAVKLLEPDTSWFHGKPWRHYTNG